MGEGHTGVQSRPIVKEDLNITLNWLVAPFIAGNTTGTIVLTGKDGAGNAKTVTIIQMKPGEVTHSMSNGSQGVWSQTFNFVVTFDTFPMTLA